MRCVAEPIPSPHPTHDSLLRLEHTRKISAICLSARDASKTHSKPPFGPRRMPSARSLPISPKTICFRPPRFATTGVPFSSHPHFCGPPSIAVVNSERLPAFRDANTCQSSCDSTLSSQPRPWRQPYSTKAVFHHW